MRFEKIHIDAFGKLIDLSFEFHPQLNIIFGPNEAGKSTLQQAILHLLFGFYQSNRARPQETELIEKYQPWQDDVNFGGHLWYRLRDGKRFQVDRNFDDRDIPTQIYDALTGEEITHQFSVKRHGNVPFLKEQLGMDKDLFEATVFVRQAEVKAIAGSKHLVQEIVGVLDSGSRERSAKQAIAHLQKKIVEIGTERAQKRKLPVLKSRLKELKEELAEQNRIRQELKQTILDKNRLQELVAEENQKRIELNYLILTKSIDQKEKQLEQLRKKRAGLTALKKKIIDYQDVENFPVEIRDSVMRRRQNRKNYEEQIQEKNQTISDLQNQVKELEKECQPLRHYETVYSLMPFAEFERYASEWRSRNQELVAAQKKVDQEELFLLEDGVDPETLQRLVDLKPEDFTRFNELEEKQKELDIAYQDFRERSRQLEGQTWATIKTRRWIIFGSPLLSLAILLSSYFWQFNIGYPVAAGVLVAGIVAYHFYRRARRKIAAHSNELDEQIQGNRQEYDDIHSLLQQQYQKYGVQSLAKLMERRMQNENYLSLVRDRDIVKNEQEKIDFQLLKYLQSIGFQKIDDDILNKVDKEYGRFSKLYSRLQTIQEQIKQSERNLATLKGKLDDNDASLLELYGQANIATQDLQQAEAEFDRYYQRRKEWNDLKKEEDKINSEIRGILSSQTEEEIRQDVDNLIHRREKLLANYPEVQEKKSPKTLSQLEEEFAEVDARRQQYEQDVRALESRIETMLEGHRPKADVEEELTHVQTEVDDLEAERFHLELARDILDEVSQNYHRSIVPEINKVVSHAMNRITDSRYSDVHVNPDDMSLNLVLPEKKTLGSADVLSLGTQEQLYLLLRMALSRLLSQNMEPIPLLLDDPFVHFDHQRMGNMLTFLAELSKENQILLFSKELFIYDWYQNEMDNSKYRAFEL